MAGNEPQILDYAPRRSVGQGLMSLLPVRYFIWICFKRPLTPGWTFIACWLVIALVRLSQAWDRQHYVPVLLATPAAFLPLIAVIAAAAALVKQRRWRALILCILFAFITSIPSGLLQFDRCPHGTYLQLMGVNLSIRGPGCNNLRNEQVWWRR